MIAQLQGTVVRKLDGALVIDVGGVGYLVHCASATFLALATGATASLRIHTAMREGSIELFGFVTELEELLFDELLRVPGVGPRTAMNILSGGDPEEIAQAIVAGDTLRLKELPGVGKKTAERLVVDLRERLATRVPARTGPSTPARPVERPAPPPPPPPPADELLLALSSLGYKPAECERLAQLARSRAPEGATLEQLVREALRAR